MGDNTFNFRDDEGHTWQQSVQVTEGVCIVVKVERPEAAAKTAQNSVTMDSSSRVSVPQDPNISELHLLSSADHASFGYPRYAIVEWTPVVQADSYEVELQLADAPYDYTATSFSSMPYTNGGIYTRTSTSITVQGMGKQVHRLRVKALRNNGVITQTDWRYINYSN